MSIARRACLLLLCLLPLVAQAKTEEEPEGDSGAPAQGSEYLAMTPAFVVNFGSEGRLGYLKADVTLRVSRAASADVEHHMPALRHALIMLLSSRSPESLAAPAERETLRLAALEAVRTVLAEAGGEAGGESATDPPAVQDLLFTSFLVQR